MMVRNPHQKQRPHQCTASANDHPRETCRFCVSNFDRMLCDDPKCPIGWYHMSCLGTNHIFALSVRDYY
jgi:hypothetical protein